MLVNSSVRSLCPKHSWIIRSPCKPMPSESEPTLSENGPYGWNWHNDCKLSLCWIKGSANHALFTSRPTRAPTGTNRRTMTRGAGPHFSAQDRWNGVSNLLFHRIQTPKPIQATTRMHLVIRRLLTETDDA